MVSLVDQRRFDPVAVKIEEPQLLVTLTTGAAGTANGAAVTEASALVHPPTVCVTLYEAAEVTVIDPVVAPVDQSRFDPVAVNTEEPQISAAETAGAAGNESGAAVPDPAGLIHPLIVCVTVYVPGVITVIDAVVSPVDQRSPAPVVDNTDEPQLFATVTTGIEGGVPGTAFKVAGKLVHPPIV